MKMVLSESKTSKIVYLILFLLANPRPSESIVLTAITTVFTMAYSMYGLFNDADDAYRKWKPQNTIDTVVDAVEGVSKKIDSLEVNIGSKIDEAVDKLLISLPLINEIKTAMKDLSDYMIDVDNLYETFEFYVEDKDLLANDTLEHLAMAIIGHDADDLTGTLGKIQKLIAPGRTKAFRGSLLDLLQTNVEEHHYETCNNGLTDQSLIYDIYAAIMMTEIRGYLMTGFAYYILNYLGKGNYIPEMKIAQKRTILRTKLYKLEFEKAGAAIPTEIVRCDVYGFEAIYPEVNTNFYGNRLKYVINELGLDPNDCSTHCDERSEPIAHSNCTDYEGCRKEDYCNGHITACKRTSDMWVGYPMDRRRFLFETYAYENKEWVSPHDKNLDEVFVGSQIDPNGNECSTCLCDCIQDAAEVESIKYIGLREAVSDIDDNKVITGFRIIGTLSGIHVVIQQGTVRSQGYVETDTVEWENFKLREPDRSHDVVDGDIPATTVDREPNEDLVEGVDYATLSGDVEAVYIDRIQVPKDYLVTDNVRLRISEPGTKPRGLRLEVRATPYDILTGRLLLNSTSPTIWLSGDDMKGVFPDYDREREEYKVVNGLRAPHLVEGLLETRAEFNSYVRIQTTGETENAGQLTLPYIETLMNYSDPPFALGGIGLFYKSAQPNASGYVSSKLTLVDPFQYMQFVDD